QDMEILGGSGEVGDLNITTCTQLQKALQSGTAVLRTLAFIAMRKQHHNATGLLPLALSTADELVNDYLCAVGKITKLCVPANQYIRSQQGIAVIESKNGSL